MIKEKLAKSFPAFALIGVTKKKYEIIRTISQLKSLAKKMAKINEFAFDTETNTLRVYGPNKDFKCVDITISWGLYNNYCIPLGHLFDSDQLPIALVLKYLKPIFAREDVTIIGHNIKFDMHVLARLGFEFKTKRLFDTMISSWICDENTPNGLKENTEAILGIDQTHFKNVLESITKEEKKSVGLKANSKGTFDLVRIENGCHYAVDDAFYTFMLYIHFLDRLVEEEMDKIYYKTYPAFLYTLFNMEERGITVDVKKLTAMGEDMKRDLEILEYEMIEIIGTTVNFGSPQQLVELLFSYDGSAHTKTDKKGNEVPIYKNPNYEIIEAGFGFAVLSQTATGAPQANGDVLEAIAKKTFKTKRKQEGVEVVKKLLEYRKIAKLHSAFVDGLLENMYDDGKAHCSFNPIGTDSGRVSCSSPNLQQLPNSMEDDESGLYELVKKYNIRDCFIGKINPKTGKRKYIISVDYSNLEVRVMAHYSEDEGLINAFLAGKDLHGNTAKMMFRLECDANDVKKLHPQLRQQGKVIAFLLQYGGSSYTLYLDLNKDGELDEIARENKDNKKSDFYGCKDGKAVAQRLMDLYFEGFPGIAKFMKEQQKYAHRNQFVYTLVGRKRRLPGINSNDYKQVGYLERLSINACIQGSGADIMMNAQNKIDGTIVDAPMSSAFYEENPDADFEFGSHRLKELECDMLVQIHDELLFECDEDKCEEAIAIIRDYMINPFGEKVKLNIPLEIGSGYSKSYAGGH